MFASHIKQSRKQITKKIYRAQDKNPCPGDTLVLNDMNSDDKNGGMNKEKYKAIKINKHKIRYFQSWLTRKRVI